MCVRMCAHMCTCMCALCVCVQAARVATISQHVYCYDTEARMPHRQFMKTYLFILETPSLLVHNSLAISLATLQPGFCAPRKGVGVMPVQQHTVPAERASLY